MTASDTPNALEPIHCDNCGAAVALAEAPTVNCPYCNARVTVPERHRAALVAEREAADARREAGQVNDTLCKLPAWPMRALAKAFSPIGVFFGGLLVPGFGSLALVLLAVMVAGAATHANLLVTTSQNVKGALLVVSWFVVMLAIVGLGVYGQRRAVSLRGIQAALAAGPPHKPGGPATCRGCGAPLQITEDALDVRCIYCGSDNLVAVPDAWIRGIQKNVGVVHKEIADANAAYGRETARLRKRLMLFLSVTALFQIGTVVFGVLGARPAEAGAETFPPEWSAHVGTPRDVLVRADAAAGARSARATTVERFAPGCAAAPRAFALDPQACDASGCRVSLHVAMRRGEIATVVADGFTQPGTMDVRALYRLAGWPASPDEPFGSDVSTEALRPMQASHVRADTSTWYQFALRVPSDNAAGFRLCVDVTAAR